VPAEEPVVRRIGPDDWPLLRDLRLEALADTPIAYLETLAAAQALADDDWQARARRGAEGGDSCQVLALTAGKAVGTTVALLADGRAWLAAVYLTRSWRGRDLLARLVSPCEAWAARAGADELRLEVHETNVRARWAYARLGFAETGETLPYPLEPGGLEVVMARVVGDP
jgi:GNAT superfamily N-acetyltransferase